MQFGIESVAAVAAAQTSLPASSGLQMNALQPGEMQFGASQGTSATGTFASLMQGWVGEINASAGAAETAMSDLATGKAVELHEVMIALEHARISVQTFVQVRNKLVESYQDVMRMQL